MSSFDPMAAAIDWLDAYRAASLSIVDFYAPNGALECSCGGEKVLYGRAAHESYWRQRFKEMPAGALADLQMEGEDIVLAYEVPGGIGQAVLHHDQDGKISLSRCGPALPVGQVMFSAVA